LISLEKIQGRSCGRATSISAAARPICAAILQYGFTSPAAEGAMVRAALYNAQADRRSWASMKGLFDEVLT
jgi:hypothetical protein